MTKDVLKEHILTVLKSRGDKKYRRRELYNLLRMKNLAYPVFKEALVELEESGAIERTRGRKVSVPGRTDMLTGVFSGSRNGGGRVVLPGGETVIVRKSGVGGAMPGDTVRVKITGHHRIGASPLGTVTGIVERSPKPVIGLYQERGKTSFIIPQDESLPHHILIREGGNAGAGSGELVVCRMVMPVTGFSRPLCEVVEVLGDPDVPGVDVLAIAKRFELPLEFSAEALEEADQLPEGIAPEVVKERRDIRDLVTVTIDPADAKDFDDAVTVSRTADNGFELGVHIADVSHFVKPDGALDREAVGRGMSCYLVDRVIPMLPERLSNGLCSLKPREDRLTKSVFAQIDPSGEVRSAECANTVINSNMRLTYEQVQAYLDGENGSGDITPEVGDLLKTLADLAAVLVKSRAERGAIDMDVPESQVILDSAGKPVDIRKRERIWAHRMIEEAMLTANTMVARKLDAVDAPLLFRVHEPPDRERLEAFGEVAGALGHTFDARRAADPVYIRAFLVSLAGTPQEHLVNAMLLRSMKKAAYSPENAGHYGLALDRYAHFTSPIRRYPDLVVHRQLDAYIILGRADGSDQSPEWFRTLGDRTTEREMVTDGAERASVKMKAAEFMQGFLGEQFEGIVSGVITNGFFVELDRYFVEGLVHVNTLDDDYYEIDSPGISLVGKRSGRRFMIGERVTVQVSRANKQMGEIDFVFIRKNRKKPHDHD